ncbi:Rho-related protein-like protein [Hapsidospora chrysogenum ATCC 11550]|uniref:Rho-related protein-like protein n=1 Tax=Hapsidospora chrysogenum (strain ATCC 11550 / CBS 779.69 / DSM 880 / IAM 14645 / JCM 23072 / IMI 49137) TaxID=857340 RepID=A0A086TGR4_HAPC1|nr:Rho-related protein-like protein [Hapsidospora chrysogenum ATCC 11550]
MDPNTDKPTSSSFSSNSWRRFIPSRLDRHDEDVETRPSTRLISRDSKLLQRRPSTRLSLLRAATPLFERASSALGSLGADTVVGSGNGEEERAGPGLWGLIRGSKRKRSPEVEGIPAEPRRVNFLFVGAKSSGQTSLLFPGWNADCVGQASAITRTCYEVYITDRTYDSRPDTSGAPDLNTVLRLSYMQWDGVFLCFDVMDKVSMFTIISWWRHAVSYGFIAGQTSEPLVHLVGMKKDQRGYDDTAAEDVPGRARSTLSLAAYPTCCVGSAEATWHAKRIGAHRYIECSALTGEGMDAVVEDAGREAVRRAVKTEDEARVREREVLRLVEKRRRL